MSRNLEDNQSRSDYTSFVDAYEVLDQELLTAKKEEEEENQVELNTGNNFGYASSATAEALKTKRIVTRAKSKDSTSKTLYKLSSVGYSVFSDESGSPSSTTTTSTPSPAISTSDQVDQIIEDCAPIVLENLEPTSSESDSQLEKELSELKDV